MRQGKARARRAPLPTWYSRRTCPARRPWTTPWSLPCARPPLLLWPRPPRRGQQTRSQSRAATPAPTTRAAAAADRATAAGAGADMSTTVVAAALLPRALPLGAAAIARRAGDGGGAPAAEPCWCWCCRPPCSPRPPAAAARLALGFPGLWGGAPRGRALWPRSPPRRTQPAGGRLTSTHAPPWGAATPSAGRERCWTSLGKRLGRKTRKPQRRARGKTSRCALCWPRRRAQQDEGGAAAARRLQGTCGWALGARLRGRAGRHGGAEQRGAAARPIGAAARGPRDDLPASGAGRGLARLDSRRGGPRCAAACSRAAAAGSPCDRQQQEEPAARDGGLPRRLLGGLGLIL